MTFDIATFGAGAIFGVAILVLGFSTYHLASHGFKRQLPGDLFGYWAHGDWRKDWQDTFRVKREKQE